MLQAGSFKKLFFDFNNVQPVIQIQAMNQENTQQCAICQLQPEDMLILSCSHNLCLDCATQLFTAAHHQDSLQCQICLAVTPLDTQTIQCLQGLATTNRSPSPRPTKVDIPRPPKAKPDAGCSQHRQKSVYFCFDCQDYSICSECILEGAHSGHSVMTIKKATKILTERIVDNSKQLDSFKTDIERKSQGLKGFRETLVGEQEERQNNLKFIFEAMIRQLTDRYNQLTKQLQNCSRRSVQILDGTLNSLNQRVQVIVQTIQQNRLVLQSNHQLQILKRYSQIELKKNAITQELLPAMPHSLKDLTLTCQSSCSSELEALLDKISWCQGMDERIVQKQNKFQLQNSLQGSLLGATPVRAKSDQILIHQPESIQRQDQGTLNKYSGIKSSSRRLQLSRSMNNATNIINRLQERVRR